MNMKITRSRIDRDALHNLFPTHRHDAKFWEALGRAIATFGFLEEVLGRAIFAFTAMRPYDENQIERAYEEWITKVLPNALKDSLGKLIPSYESAVLAFPNATGDGFGLLIYNLRQAKDIRDVLCHASWRQPDSLGRSLPYFINTKLHVFDSLVDVAFLEQTRKEVVELACDVIDSVTLMGWQFPGSNGKGFPIKFA